MLCSVQFLLIMFTSRLKSFFTGEGKKKPPSQTFCPNSKTTKNYRINVETSLCFSKHKHALCLIICRFRRKNRKVLNLFWVLIFDRKVVRDKRNNWAHRLFIINCTFDLKKNNVFTERKMSSKHENKTNIIVENTLHVQNVNNKSLEKAGRSWVFVAAHVRSACLSHCVWPSFFQTLIIEKCSSTLTFTCLFQFPFIVDDKLNLLYRLIEILFWHFFNTFVIL